MNGTAEVRAEAMAAYRRNPQLTGADLGRKFGRSDRWGRLVIEEVEKELASGTETPAVAGAQPETSGNVNGKPSGNSGGNQQVEGVSAQHPAGRRNGTNRADPRSPKPEGNGKRNGTGIWLVPTEIPPGKRNGNHPENGTSAPAGNPRLLINVTVVAVAIVATVTTVTSYTHTHDLALMAGQAWLAKILPAAVDGLVIAGSTSLLVDRQHGRRGHPLAWTAVVIGLASSMAANVVAVDPTLVDLRVVKWVMAGYAPVALAVSGHLLLRMLGEHRTTDQEGTTTA
jgi:Protein of unknown function (DUF2637)